MRPHTLSVTRIGQAGFTLVELVVVIVLVGILAVVGANIIGNFVSGYTTSAERSKLAGVGRAAIERMTREIRRAVPNSIQTFNSGRQITFLRMNGGGRYVAVGASASRLQPGLPGDRFVAYGLSGLDAADQLAVYPLSAGPLYSSLAGTTSRTRARINDAGSPAAGNESRSIVLDPDDALARGSPQRRLLTIDGMVSFCLPLGNNKLRMAIEPVTAGLDPPASNWCDTWGTDAPLAAPVASASFDYREPTLTRSGLVRIYLELTSPESGESVDFQQEVHVRNVP